MFEEVCQILADQLNLDPAQITPDQKIKDDLGADSLDMLQLLMTLEEEKGITIPDDALPNLKTVGEIVSFLENNQ